jgi:energy-coupling factor transporter ATP-binding protein EcfA2
VADDRFYVKTLRLQNFRCFEDVELGPFDPSFNLLVGENGAGKSSVLVALADLFRPLAAGGGVLLSNTIVGFADQRRNLGQESFLTFSESIAPWLISAKFVSKFKVFQVRDLYHAQPSFENQPKVGEVVAGKNVPTPVSGGLLAARVIDVPHVIAMYKTDRRFQTETKPPETMIPDGPGTSFINWTDAGTSSYFLKEWLRDETLISLQAKQPAPENGSDLSAWLDVVSSALSTCYEGVSSINYNGVLKDVVLTYGDGSSSTFDSLSDGQRALAGLVVDIARRCFILNGRRFGKETLELTSGLVLIDEIELHLHPKWQRQIVPALKKIFPKIQFFATTHSPQVIGECKPEEIVLLTPEGQKRPAGSFGMDSNWILQCVMEAEGRNPEIAKRIKSLFDLIESERLAEAKAEIARLRQELPEVAPDIVSAEAYIWNLEHESGEAAE